MAKPERIEEILIVRLGALGDVARVTALVERIRYERPGARVTWLVATSAIPLLELVPGVDRMVPVNDERIFRGSVLSRIREVLSIWIALAGRTFDLALLAHPDPRFRVLLAGVRVRRSRVVPKPTRESVGYIGDEFAQLLDDAPIQPGQYPIADLRANVSQVQLPDAAQFGNRPAVLLVPGGARNVLRDDPLRRWPMTSYVALAERLIADGFDVGLVGGSSDEWARSAFAGLPVRDLIGRLSIPQTLRLMAGPAVIVTHDTGPLHLAQLVRARTVALFGPTVPSRVVGTAANVVALWGGKHLACRPCYDGASYAVCHRNLCMEDIGVDEVLHAVRSTASTG